MKIKLENSWLKEILMFISVLFYITIVSLYYFEITKSKNTSYVKNLQVHSIDYIIPPNHELEFGDSDAYNKLAYSLITRGDFYNPVGQKSAWVTPGYPLFLAGIYLVFGINYLSVYIIQILLLTLCYYLIYKVTRKYFGKPAGFIVLGILLLNLRFIAYVPQIYTETLFLFVIALILFLYFELIYNPQNKYIKSLLGGILLGYAALVRPVILPLLIILPAFMVLFAIKKRYIIIFVFCSIIIFSLWIVRNYHIFNRFLISTNSEMTLSSGYLDISNFNFLDAYSLNSFINSNMPPLNKDFDDSLEIAKKKLLGKKSNIQYPQSYIYEPVSELFKKRYFDYKIKEPINFVLRSLYLFKTLLLPYTNDMSKRNKILSTIIWIITFVPFYFSLFFLKKDKIYWLLFVVGLSFLIAPSINIVDTNLRYQLPTQLVITIIAGLMFNNIFIKIKRITKVIANKHSSI